MESILSACLSQYCNNGNFTVLRNARDHISSITALRQQAGFRHYRYGDATSVLRLFRNTESTDPRDKLWGFVGCFDWENALYSPPDYKLPVVELFTEVAKVAFEWSGWLYMLGEAGRAKQCSGCEFPSWVPDWSYRLEGLSFTVLGEGSKFRRKDPLKLESMAPLFYAGGEMISTDEAGGLFPAPGILSIKIKSFGALTSQTKHPGNYHRASSTNNSDTSTMRGSNPEYHQCIALAETSLAAVGAKDAITSIRATVARTLVAGLNGYDSKIPWDVDTYFPHWIEQGGQHNDGESATLSNNAAVTAYAVAVDRALCMAYTSGLHYFAMLDHRFFAVVSTMARVGDEVVVVSGAPTAYVVRMARRQEGKRVFEFIGEAYVYSFMHGELSADHEVPWESVWLI